MKTNKLTKLLRTLKKRNTIYKWLIYLTNNEQVSKHEIGFDVIFFIISTTALILGTIILFQVAKEWIAFLVIEWVWCFDSLRHNR